MKTVEYFDMAFVPAMYFGFTTSKAAFAKEVQRLNIKNAPEFCFSGAAAVTHFFTSEDKVTALVCLDSKRAKKFATCQIAAICAHEAVHVWQECRRKMRETAPGDEVEAYAIQFFTQRMLECLKL